MGRVDLLDLFDLVDAAPPMNADLARWAEERPPDAAAGTPKVTGPCRDCDSAATARCLRCAAAVCVRHHHVMYGLCVRCAPTDAGEAPRDLRDVLDVPWVDD